MIRTLAVSSVPLDDVQQICIVLAILYIVELTGLDLMYQSV